METMITDRETATGGRNSRATHRVTEGTAVFVGRNSFRMMPASHAGLALETTWPNMQTETQAPAEDWVVLTPPPTAIHGARIVEMINDGPGTAPMDLVSASAFAPSDHQDAVARRGTPFWVVAAALVAGAAVTLTAQAVLRRPARETAMIVAPAIVKPAAVEPVVTLSAPLVALTTPIATQADSATPVITAISPAATVADPVVPADLPDSADRAGNVAATVTKKVSRARSQRISGATPRSQSTPASATGSPGSRWVDPFAGKLPVRPDIKSTAVRDSGATASITASASTKSTWVDPFAD